MADSHSISRFRLTSSLKNRTVASSYEPRRWLEKNKRKLLTGAAIIGGIFLCGAIFIRVSRYHEERALNELRSALVSLQDRTIGPEQAKAIFSLPQAQQESAYLSQMILFFQGRKAEEDKNIAAAKGIYENASKIEGPFAGEILLSLARAADAEGDSTTALSARERFLTAYPNAPQAEVVRQKIGK